MKKALVIYNPISGARKWRDVPALIQETLREHDYEWLWQDTQPNQDLRPFFQGDFDRVVVAGGDGTIAEVVTVMIEQEMKIPLVALPQGSGNLLALALGIPILQIRKALELGLQEEGKLLDVMRVNKRRYGVIAVGRGYDAFLMQETPRALKRKLGFLAYFWVFLKTFFFYRSKPYKLTLDRRRVQVLAKFIMVFNLLPYTKVDPQDGLLNTLVLTSRGRVLHFTSKNVVIKAKKEFKFQVDGEVCRGKVVNIEVRPRALSIVY